MGKHRYLANVGAFGTPALQQHHTHGTIDNRCNSQCTDWYPGQYCHLQLVAHRSNPYLGMEHQLGTHHSAPSAHRPNRNLSKSPIHQTNMVVCHNESVKVVALVMVWVWVLVALVRVWVWASVALVRVWVLG